MIKVELELLQNLKDVGFSHLQAEACLKAVEVKMNQKFATREDLKEAVYILDSRITEVSHKVDLLKSELIIKLGLMQAFSTGLLATLIKLF